MRWVEINEDEAKRNAFERWFSGSKIVDAAGKPLKLYRGMFGEQAMALDRMQPRVGYAMFFTTSPAVAASYALPDRTFGGTGATFPVFVKADALIEFPTNGDGGFDMFAFDDKAKRLKPGVGLVARGVRDCGPRARKDIDPEAGYSYPSDIYAFGHGTSVKSAISNTGAYDPDNPVMTEAAKNAPMRKNL